MSMKKFGKDKKFTGQKILLAEKICNPDENGISRIVSIEEFSSQGLTCGNGSPGWLRADGSSSLYSKYIVKIEKDGNKNISVKLDGYSENPNTQRTNIPAHVRKFYKGKLDIITGTSKSVEIDHKNGYFCIGENIEDFQILTRHMNIIKREYCKSCKDTGYRYDARKAGYKVGWTQGGPIHTKKLDGCKGCYWFDPLKFNEEIGKNY